jgi:AcrR family transcriptional regulator
MKLNKEHILSQAAQLFKEKGYAGATMRELAVMLGVEAASLYYHIPNKEALLKEICFWIGQEYISHIVGLNQTSYTPPEKIRHFVHLHIQTSIREIDFVSVANHEWRHLSPENLDTYIIMRKQYENALLQIIEEGISHKVFVKINPTIAVYTLLSSIRWVEQWYRSDRKISQQVLEEDITRMIMGGLLVSNIPISPLTIHL